MRQEPNRAGEMAAFVHVVEAGGFAPAAGALGLTPSAVSKLVTRLEQRLGAVLLRRSTRRIALTPEGEQFHARAVAILAEIEAAEREAGGAVRPSGRIRVNSSASYVAHVLADILPAFLDQHPEISLDIVQTDAVADLLKDGSDVAIRAGELANSSLIARSLGRTPFVVVAAPSWLERHGVPASLDDLLAGDRLGFAYRRTLEDWFQPAEPDPARVRVSDGEGIRRLALAGAGPARLAEFTVRKEIADGRLVRILTEGLPVGYEPFHAVYIGRSGQLPARIRVFLDHLAQAGRVE